MATVGFKGLNEIKQIVAWSQASLSAGRHHATFSRVLDN